MEKFLFLVLMLMLISCLFHAGSHTIILMLMLMLMLALIAQVGTRINCLHENANSSRGGGGVGGLGGWGGWGDGGWGSRQLGWASCLVSAGRVTLSGGTNGSNINTLARLPRRDGSNSFRSPPFCPVCNSRERLVC